MNIKKYFFLIIILPLLPGCAALNEINSYTAISVSSLNKINEVDYTFDKYCRRDCELQQLRSGAIDTLFHCDCQVPAAKADEAIQKIHFTITSYLNAIEQLSNNKSFTYDVSNLTASLQQNPLLNLTDNQVDIYTKAGNFISTAATAFYRKKKLKQYIEKADPIFQQFTETFIFIINNRLRQQLRINYEVRLANLQQMLDNAKNNPALKQIIIKMFLDEQAYYKRHNILIDNYAALLENVKKGHHDLYVQRSNLTNAKTKALLRQYTKEVQNIAATVESNKLNKIL